MGNKSRWRSVKKIDAHIHLFPDKMCKDYHGDDLWGHVGVDYYLPLMEKYNIEKAIVLPINARYDMGADDVNKWLGSVVSQNPNKFIAFADIQPDGAKFINLSPYYLEKAVKEYGLKGLKIHPTNLQMDADDLQFVPVLRKAAELKVPVLCHSYPSRWGFYDNCSPAKISRMIRIFPDVKFITAHLGGMQYLDALAGCTYVDTSYVVPEFIKLFGVEQTNRILRAFGVDRLIFGSDFLQAQDYEMQFEALDQMDFTDEEIEKIAYKNILQLLNESK